MTIEEVRKCQLKQLDALKFIDRVCRENELKYFVHTGTLLGAVRHQGYIPWDMDTDILMPMEDTKKFLHIVEEMHDPRYTVISEDESWFSSDRLIAKTAKCYGEAAKDIIDQYIHVDIYSYGNGKPKPSYLTKFDTDKTRIIHRLIAYREGRNLFQSEINRSFIRVLDKLYKKKATSKLREMLKSSALYETETGWYTVYNSYYGFSKETYSKNIYRETVYLPFEDMKVPAPIGYIEVLERLYGNWQTLPPENERYPVYLKDMYYEEL